MNPVDKSTTRAVMNEHIYKSLAAAAVILILAATVAYRLLEDWSWVDSLYFSVVAVTTVGFGDLTPSTDASKLFTVVYVLGGISIITTYLHARMSRNVNKRTEA